MARLRLSVPAAVAGMVALGLMVSAGSARPRLVRGGAVACGDAVENASAGGGYGIEQSVAVDPLNTNNILIGSIGAAASSGVVVSHDCGRTWTRAYGFTTCTGDQDVGWDRHGNAYFICDTLEDYYSTDAGDHWSGPVVAASPADNMGDVIDRPWMVVDNTGGPRDGTVYITYESFFTDPLGWVFERSSTDHGHTWGPVHRVDDPAGQTQQNPRQVPAIGADGTLYVAYDQGFHLGGVSDTTPETLIVARSHDGGVTYQRSVAATGVIRSGSPEDEGEIISSLAADPSPKRAGHLALAWADKRSGESRVLMAVSIDGGVTWSPPVDVADDKLHTGNGHDHVQAAFLPDGRVVVVWRDRRCCGGQWTDKYQIFARALSIGAGRTLIPGRTVQVTDAPQEPNTSSSLNEYIGMTAGPEGVSVAWDQMVGSTPENVYRRLALSDFGPAHPVRHRHRRRRHRPRHHR